MKYTLIFNWMFELGGENPLSLSEVMTYAQIYSYSRDGKGTFKGSYKYLTTLTRLKERQQINILNKLVADGLIIKIETAEGYPNEYKCNMDFVPEEYKGESSQIKNKDLNQSFTQKSNLSHQKQMSCGSRNDEHRQLDFAETGLFDQKEN